MLTVLTAGGVVGLVAVGCSFLLSICTGNDAPAYTAEAKIDGVTFEIALVQTHPFYALYRANVQVKKGDEVIAQKEFELAGPDDRSSLHVFRKPGRFIVVDDSWEGFGVDVDESKIVAIAARDIPKDFPNGRIGTFKFVNGAFSTRFLWVPAEVAAE